MTTRGEQMWPSTRKTALREQVSVNIQASMNKCLDLLAGATRRFRSFVIEEAEP